MAACDIWNVRWVALPRSTSRKTCSDECTAHSHNLKLARSRPHSIQNTLQFFTAVSTSALTRTQSWVVSHWSELVTAFSLYTVSQKKEATKLWAVALSNLKNFKNYFTDRLSWKFAIQRYVVISPHLTYVATLPCETWTTEKPTKFTMFLKKTSWCIFVRASPNAN